MIDGAVNKFDPPDEDDRKLIIVKANEYCLLKSATASDANYSCQLMSYHHSIPEEFKKFSVCFLRQFSLKCFEQNLQQKYNDEIVHFMHRRFKKGNSTVVFEINSRDIRMCNVDLAIKTVDLVINTLKSEQCPVKRVVFCVLESRTNILKSLAEAFDVCFFEKWTIETITSTTDGSSFSCEPLRKLRLPATYEFHSHLFFNPAYEIVQKDQFPLNDRTGVSGSDIQSIEAKEIANDQSCSKSTILIRNYHETALRVLENHFWTYRQSGGGPIRRIVVDQLDGGIFIEFFRDDVCERVLGKNRQIIDHKQVFVTRQTPVDKSRFYLILLPEWVTDDQLKRLLKTQLDVEVVRITFNRKELFAFVELAAELKSVADLENLTKISLNGENNRVYIPIIHEVRHSDTVVFFGELPDHDAAKVFIETYLSEVSSDVTGTVRYIVPGTGMPAPSTLITFEDYRAVELMPNRLQMNDIDYSIVPFYPFVCIL